MAEGHALLHWSGAKLTFLIPMRGRSLRPEATPARFLEWPAPRKPQFIGGVALNLTGM
jgi:hypothetical protein